MQLTWDLPIVISATDENGKLVAQVVKDGAGYNSFDYTVPGAAGPVHVGWFDSFEKAQAAVNAKLQGTEDAPLECEPAALPEGTWIPEGPHGGCKFVDGDGATLARIVPSLGKHTTYYVRDLENPYQGYSTLEIAKLAAIRALRMGAGK